jgi:cell division transport system permease protein
MAAEKNKPAFKVRSSYVSTIISISLVLFMMGVLGLILLNAKKISNHVKENIGYSLYLQDEISERQLNALQTDLLAKA